MRRFFDDELNKILRMDPAEQNPNSPHSPGFQMLYPISNLSFYMTTILIFQIYKWKTLVLNFDLEHRLPLP